MRKAARRQEVTCILTALFLTLLVPTAWAAPAGTWTGKSSLQQARTNHTATLLANGKILVVGGEDAAGHGLPTAELYDPATGAYTLVSTNLPVPVSGHTATLLKNGNVLIVGGKAESGAPIPYAQVFDAGTASFSGPLGLYAARNEHTATLLNDDRVLIAGGSDGTSALADLEVYDALANAFTRLSSGLVNPRQRHTATLLDDGKVIFIGGNDASGSLASAELYDPSNNTVATIAGINSARTKASAALLLDGTILIVGGQNSSGQDLDTAEIYDPTAHTSTPLPVVLSAPRSRHVGLRLQDNGRVIIAGGTTAGNLATSVEVYNPITQTFSTLGPLLTARKAFGTNFFAPPYTGGLLATGGVDVNNIVLRSSELFSYPTLRTDKLDYPPGYTVKMMGEGWQPNETIDILIHENNGDPDISMTVSADTNGAFSFDAFQTDMGDLNMTFLATATGPVSNWTAQAKFSDSQPGGVSLAPASVSVAAGSSAIYTTTVTKAGNNNACDITLSISANPVATGANGSFSLPNPFTMTTADVVRTLTITTTNTGPMAGRTQPGTYPFTVTATKAANCQGGVGTVTNNSGILIVLGAANHIAFAQQPTNAVSSIAISPSVIVQILDSNNNVVINTSASITVAIGNNSGGGTLAGTVTQNAVSGVATFNNLSINRMGTGYTLTASSSGLTGATSNAFNITLGAAAKVRVETAVDGTGTIVPAQSVTSGSSITVFSIRRDAGDNFIDNVSLGSMSDWSLVSITGGVVAGDLNPAGNKRSAVFTGNAAGSAVIHAAFSGLASVDSGTLTVSSANVATTLVLNSVSPNSVPYGSTGPVAFTATLTRTTGGAAVAGATVNFTVDGVAAGSGITDGSGVATFTTYNPSSLSVSGHNVQASFTAVPISGTSYLGSTSGTQTLTVTKATPTITWANPADITYGTALSGTQLNATASVPGSFVYTPAVGAILNAGAGQSLHVAFTPTDTTNYNSPTKDVLINALPAPVTVTFTAADKTYDGTDTATVSACRIVTGKVGADDVTCSVAAGHFASANASASAQDVSATATLGGTKASNYTVTNPVTKTAAAKINKAHLTVKADDKSKTYDGAVFSPFTATITGFVNAETVAVVSGSAAYSANATAAVNAGIYTITPTVGTLSATNYDFTTFNTGTLTIAKANAVIVVTPYSVTYNGAPHTATGTATGVLNESLSGLDLSGTTQTNAGTYNGDAWAFTDVTGNYNNANGTVNDSIAKADPVMTAAGGAFTYDGTAHAGSGSAKGVVGEDLTPVTVAYSLSPGPGNLLTAAPVNAGAYQVSARYAGNGNYNQKQGAAVALTIAKANALIGVTPYSVNYDGAPHTATGTAKGVLNESLSGLDLSSTTHTNAGTYNGDAWAFTDVTGNYNNANGTVNDSIAKINATITVTPYSVTYNAVAHTATGTATGVGGANLNASLTLTGTTHTDAGTYNNDPWSFAGGTNYNDANGTVNDSIAKATATIVVTPYSVTYDAAAHTATGTATGVGGANLNTGLTLTGTTHTNAGTYNGDPWGFAGGTNYNDASGTVNDSVAKATATIVVMPYSVTYDGISHIATGTATGVGSANLSTGLSLIGTTHTNAGSYTIDPWTFAGGTNYNDASGTVNDSIAKAILTVTADNKTMILNGPLAPFTATFAGFQHGETLATSGVTGSSSLTTTTIGNAIGTFVINAALGTLTAGNYAFTFVPGTLSVTYVLVGGTCIDNVGHSILQPVNSDGTSVFKQKSTVPAKFRVCDANGVSIGTPGVVAYFWQIQTISGVVTAIDETVDSTTPDTAFRWDPSVQQWIFNMNTKSQSAGLTYVYRIGLNDGTNIDFKFGLK